MEGQDLYRIGGQRLHQKRHRRHPSAAPACYIRGELSNYKIYPSGHHYFTLKDGEGALRCVMFKGSAMKLRFRPENGMQVIAYGRISVYPAGRGVSALLLPAVAGRRRRICMWPSSS